MNILESFLSNCLVVKLDSYADIVRFINHARKLGFERVYDLFRVSKGDYTWMEHNIPYDELCIEYQMGKGFTISDKTGNLNYGNQVVTLSEFIAATTMEHCVPKDRLPIFEELEALPNKINVVLHCKKYIPTQNPYGSNEGYYKCYDYTGTIYCVDNMMNCRVFKGKTALKNVLDSLYTAGSFDLYEITIVHK